MSQASECSYTMTNWRNCSLEEKLRKLNKEIFFGQN